MGDALQGPDGRWYEVTNIASGTVLSILPGYQGATVAGGAYGLAPMQGYVKESADRLRQTVEQFGATLALLGSASSSAQLRENIGAASRGVNSDITSLTGMTTALSVAQGGTGGKTVTAARQGLGLKSAATADIVGNVSQAGGVPSGAIIESSSNSNGGYTKYADGTLICWGFPVYPANSTANIEYIFPAIFSSTPAVFAQARGTASGASSASYVTEAASPTATSCQVKTLIHTATTILALASNITIHVIAIGRWY
ncbi:MAG: phage tail protein [Pseudomonas palmensis]|uniref:phage tail protein n=1 Tax=Pseudomonas palmensis TaxID=2815362 RepID=UPI003D0C4AB6